jgi:hypothetical protein
MSGKYDESIITPNDFKTKIDEIETVIKDCSIEDFKDLFATAMKTLGTTQDMKKFEPFTANYISFFTRQIISAVYTLDYDTLCQYYDYVIALRDAKANH